MTDAPKLLSREHLDSLLESLRDHAAEGALGGSLFNEQKAVRAIRAHIAALEAERDVLKATGALKVNADVIAMILSEAGVRDASYLAVKIANELDPPNLPSYDPMQVARFYLLLGKPDAPTATLSHEAARRVAEFSAAYARGLEDAALWHESAALFLSWSAEIEFHERSAAAIRSLKLGGSDQ